MYLYGASGHGKVIAEIAELKKKSITAFIDNDEGKSKILGYPVLHKLPEEDAEIIISIGNNQIRKRLAQTYPQFKFPTLIHPQSILSSSATIGDGTVVMAGVIINSSVKIGKHCIINTHATIEHDCIIEDYVHISPKVVLTGTVSVGEGSHIGVGACIIPGISIGKWCTIGAGSVVLKDVPDGAVVVGNPARVIKSRVQSF